MFGERALEDGSLGDCRGRFKSRTALAHEVLGANLRAQVPCPCEISYQLEAHPATCPINSLYHGYQSATPRAWISREASHMMKSGGSSSREGARIRRHRLRRQTGLHPEWPENVAEASTADGLS